MGGRKRRGRVEHTDGWEQIELLCAWPEQRDYELICLLVLFGDPVAERPEETGTSERTLYRKTSAFDLEGMERKLVSNRATPTRSEDWQNQCSARNQANNRATRGPQLNLAEIEKSQNLTDHADYGRLELNR